MRAMARVHNISNKNDFDSHVSKIINFHFNYHAIWTRSRSKQYNFSILESIENMALVTTNIINPPGVDPRA